METRYGSAVKPLTRADEKGWAWFERLEDGARRNWHLSDIRMTTEERHEMELLPEPKQLKQPTR